MIIVMGPSSSSKQGSDSEEVVATSLGKPWSTPKWAREAQGFLDTSPEASRPEPLEKVSKTAPRKLWVPVKVLHLSPQSSHSPPLIWERSQ